MEHYIKKCKECDTVISQCRCADKNKNVLYESPIRCGTCHPELLSDHDRKIVDSFNPSTDSKELIF